MRRESRTMMVSRLLLTLMVVAATMIAPLGRVARAQVAAEVDGTAQVITGEAGEVPPDEMERWWGVAGAMLCGAEIRIIRVAPAIGMNPYAIAAGLAGCILATIDII